MEKLHPNSVWFFFFGSVVKSIGFLFVFSVWLSIAITNVLSSIPLNRSLGSYFLLLLIAWLCLFALDIAFCYIVAKLTYHYWRYELTEDAFRKESGIIWKRYVSVPYERIQNVDIYRGVFARILGLSDLQIQTAGSSAIYSGRGGMMGVGAEGRLPGLDKITAEKLRDELIRRAKQQKVSL